MSEQGPEPITLLAALADAHRLQIAGLLVAQALTEAEIGQALGLRPKVVQRALRQLQSAGLVHADVDTGATRYATEIAALRSALAAARPRAQRGPSELGDASAEEQAVLMTFFAGDRLVSLPVQPGKLTVVLGWLAGRFEQGRDYPEREVNELLLRHHEDYATLRRLLVDHGYMTRERGVYRRMEPKTPE